MARNIIAVIAGVITGYVSIILLELIGHVFYPAPPEIDFRDIDQVRVYINSAPAGALILVLIAYFTGSFGGGLIASKVAVSDHLLISSIVGLILLIGGVLNLASIPHPLWFSVISIIIYIPAAYFGGKVGLATKKAA